MKKSLLIPIMISILVEIGCKDDVNSKNQIKDSVSKTIELAKINNEGQHLFNPNLYYSINLPLSWEMNSGDNPSHEFPDDGTGIQQKLQASYYAGKFDISKGQFGLLFFYLGGDYQIPGIAVIDHKGKILDNSTTSQGNCGNMFICDDTCMERFLIHNSRSFETKLTRIEHWCEEKLDWDNDSSKTIITEESRIGTIAEDGKITISESKFSVSEQ